MSMAAADPVFESVQRFQATMETFGESLSKLCKDNKSESVLDLWKNIEGCYHDFHKALQSRYETLEIKEKKSEYEADKITGKNPEEVGTRDENKENKTSKVTVSSPASSSFTKVLSSVEVSVEIKTLCDKADGHGLLNFIVENREKVENLRNELLVALSKAPDAAKLVLKSLEGYDFSKSGWNAKERVESLCSVNRRACILLLESLFPVFGNDESGVVPSDVKESAREIAKVWRKEMKLESKSGGMSQLDIQAFLQLLVTFRIVEDYGKDELWLLVRAIAHLKQTPELCRSLGFSSEVATLPPLFAVRYAHVLGIMDKIDPVGLLTSYLRGEEEGAKGLVEKGLKKGRDSTDTKINSINKRAASLKHVIGLIEECGLQSHFCENDFQNKHRILVQEKEDMMKKRKEDAKKKAEEKNDFIRNRKEDAKKKAEEKEDRKEDAEKKAQEEDRKKAAEKKAHEEVDRKKAAEKKAQDEEERKKTTEKKAQEKEDREKAAKKKAQEEEDRKKAAEKKAQEKEDREKAAKKKAQEEEDRKKAAEKKAQEKEDREKAAKKKAQEKEDREKAAKKKAQEEEDRKKAAEKKAQEKEDRKKAAEKKAQEKEDRERDAKKKAREEEDRKKAAEKKAQEKAAEKKAQVTEDRKKVAEEGLHHKRHQSFEPGYGPSERENYASKRAKHASPIVTIGVAGGMGNSKASPYNIDGIQKKSGIIGHDHHASAFSAANRSSSGLAAGAFTSAPSIAAQINAERRCRPSDFGTSNLTPIGSSLYGSSVPAGALAVPSYNVAEVNYEGRGQQSYTMNPGEVNKNHVRASVYGIGDLAKPFATQSNYNYEGRGQESYKLNFGEVHNNPVSMSAYGTGVLANSSATQTRYEGRGPELYTPAFGGGNTGSIGSSVYGSNSSTILSSDVNQGGHERGLGQYSGFAGRNMVPIESSGYRPGVSTVPLTSATQGHLENRRFVTDMYLPPTY